MLAKSLGRALALLMVLPSAAFALGLGDIHLLSPLNAPLDAEIELVDASPEELQTLKAQLANRDTFARYGLDWPVFLGSVQVRTAKAADGRPIIKLKSTDSITEPFVTLLVEVNWAKGRLVREYTMLLDPPVYTPGQAAGASAPVAAPSTSSGNREGAIARGADQTPAAQTPQTEAPAQVAPPSQGAPKASARSSQSTQAQSSASEPVAASSAETTAGTHLIKRGETLSGIAANTSGNPVNSPQTRTWMLAIYQANPAAFESNMNLMRSGAVLRIPDASQVSAISPSEANGEIRRQYAAWRSNTPSAAPGATASEPGRLRLVTPTETGAGGAAGSGGDVQALQGRVKDLESQLNESKRLIDIRNAELARLQAQLAAKGAPPAATSAPPAAAPAAPATPPPVAAAAPEKAPSKVEAPAPSASAPEATAPPATPAEEPAAAAPPAAPPAAPTDQRAHRPLPTPTTSVSGGSFIDTLKDYWWALALLAVAVLALVGLRAWRSRRESEFDDSLGRLAVAGASGADRFSGGDTAPVRPLTAAGAEGAFLVEESGSHQRPRIPGAAPVAPAARHVSSDETISSDTAINLDQGDPLAEADFHMAYGLYDQAADLIRIAISREPTRRDLKLKLLEVFFVWGNKDQFLQSARELASTREEAAPGEWEKIVIMGKQLAPDDPLFAGGSAVSGATAGGVDLDLEGGESRVDFDLLGDPVPGHGPQEVDLDIGSALGETDTPTDSSVAATDRSSGLDTTASQSTGTTRQMTQKLNREPEPLMPEFTTETEGPTVEQPGLATTTENPTIRQKVAMALKQGNPAEQTAELAIDDLGLDLGSLDTVDQPGLGSTPDAPTLVAGMDDHSRKVIEEAQQRAAREEHDDEHDVSATAAFRIDEQDLESALSARAANGHGHAEQSFDSSSTARLASLSSEEVDFDLGDSSDHGAHGTNGSGVDLDVGGPSLDLDVGTATVPDAGFTATQKLAADDLALPDLEPVTMSEVGTKLDLARAYMDMGDPEGARNILEEVLHEGSVAQKQEAQRLLESLPG